jgi:hypothetical protein
LLPRHGMPAVAAATRHVSVFRQRRRHAA